MLAEIITIGDEILIGQIVDTNSAWMARKLNEAGIRIIRVTSVPDEQDQILIALEDAKSRAAIVLITGGLGPTKDDITKKALAAFFNSGLRRDPAALENVERIFSKYNRSLLEVNKAQADVLENCRVLINQNGTAPGMWIVHNEVVYISMPGVPFEMMYLMEEEVIPRLKETFRLPVIVHHTILTAGVGESFLAEAISEVEESLPSNIRLAYLPKLGQVRLRLSGYGSDEQLLRTEIGEYAARITALAGEYVIGQVDQTIEKTILDIMSNLNLTLSAAESCTGGYISHLITQHPGCSSVFAGGAISYSYELKKRMLGVSEHTLNTFGAVSEETVTQMAQGAIKNYDTDYSIAVSGIAGPGGGTADKKVGTVWIAVASRERTATKKYGFGNKRAQNIERSAMNAFIMLHKMLREDYP